MYERRRVTVQVGTSPREPVSTVRPRLVLVGLCPFDGPWLVDRLPEARVADSRYTPHRLGVEHLRLRPGQPLGALPGLDAARPSLLRDAAALALAAGCPSVDLLLARVPGVNPWHLTEPRALDLLTRALGELPGTVVVFPDAAGAPDAHLDSPEADLEPLIATGRAYARTLSRHYQLGVLDLPPRAAEVWHDALRRLRHRDLALAAWTGPAPLHEAHAWRSGAAWVGGRLAAQKTPMQSAAGQRLALPGGRAVVRDRRRWLGQPTASSALPPFAEGAVCELRLDDRGVVLTAEPTLRAPLGSWDAPLVRTAKVIHQRIAITANLFVFREATEANALLLQSALHMALQDFVRRDVIVGPSGDRPQIHVMPQPNPAQPALVATVRAYLRPWVRELRLELSVRPGDAVVREVA